MKTRRGDPLFMVAIMLAIGILIAAAILIFAPRPAHAHDHEHPDLNEWMKKLTSKRGWCCNGSDADAVEWRTTEIDKCRITGGGAPEDDRKGLYCVYLDKEWWLVPDIAVIDGEPNLDGRALVWGFATRDTNGVLQDLYIRCFLPGAGT